MTIWDIMCNITVEHIGSRHSMAVGNIGFKSENELL